MSISFWIFDRDSKRRHEVCRALLAKGIFANPFADLDELSSAGSFQSDVTIMVADDKSAVENVASLMADRGVAVSLVAYRNNAAPVDVVNALRAGATDYANWPIDVDTVRLRSDEYSQHLQETLCSRNNRNSAKKAVRSLSARETDVLRELCEGQTNKGIARRLGISPRTVEIHRANMMRKLDANHVSDAVRIGLAANS